MIAKRRVRKLKEHRDAPQAQNREYSDVKHNIERRKRYHSDPEYREAALARSRKRYRKNENKEFDTCLHSLEFYRTLAITERVFTPAGKPQDWPVMNLPTTAKVLQKLYQTVWRWVHKDMIPAPVLAVAGRTEKVYHADEVKVLIETLGEHERSFAYYRSDHTEVRDLLFKRINAVRRKHGIEV